MIIIGEVLDELLVLLDELLEEIDELPDKSGGAELSPPPPPVVLDATIGLVVVVLFARVFITRPVVNYSDMLVLFWSEARSYR